MPSEAVRQAAGSLQDLIGGFPDMAKFERDAWLGKRGSPRYKLSVPVWIRPLTEAGPGPAHPYELRDISDTGIGLTSELRFEPQQRLQVDLCVNNIGWSSRMVVAHCTEAISGYNVGLELSEAPPPKTAPPVVEEPLERPRRLQNLEQVKEEICKAMRAYHLARVSWGLLGTPVKKRVLRVIEELLPASAELSGEKDEGGWRKHRRLGMEGDVHLVIPLHYGWKWLRARINDVSQDGAGLSIPFDLIDNSVERELAGEFKICPEMTVIVGLGAEPDTIWVPAEVVHGSGPKDGAVHIGVQFNTAGAQKAFGA